MSEECQYYLTVKLTDNQISNNKKKIKDISLNNDVDPNFDNLNDRIVTVVFDAVDDVYFGGKLRNYISLKGDGLICTVGYDIKDAVATTEVFFHNGNTTKRWYTVSMNSRFNELDITNTDKLYSNGITCKTKLDCLINVLCHEVIHIIQFLYCGYEGTEHHGGHDDYFLTLAKNMFGYNDYYHYFWDPE
jgi:hypothetical protein